MAKKEMTVHQEANTAVALSTDTRGFEAEISQDDIIIPRAKLLQPLSPELRELDIKAGHVINSLTKEELPASFVPIFFYKEFMRFNPRNKADRGYMDTHEPGQLIWKTRDQNDARVVAECGFGANGEHPIALTTLNFFSLFDGQPVPVIISFTKTSYKAGKTLLSLAKLRGGAMFSRRYKLTVKEENNAKGNYFTLNVTPNGDCDADMLKVAESYFNQFAGRRDAVKAHVEDAETL